MFSCQDDDNDVPVTAETQQLREQYNSIVPGDWYYFSPSGNGDSVRVYEHLKIYANGKIDGIIRTGYVDSTLVTITHATTTKNGTTSERATTHNYRYVTNDTISGTWSLENHAPDANYLTIQYDSKALKINEERIRIYNHAITLTSPSIRFYSANANSLVINDVNELPVTFTHVPVQPNF